MKTRFLCLLLAFLCLAHERLVSGDIFTAGFNDKDVLMPAFFTMDINEGLNGTINLNVQFQEGKVVSVKVLSSQLNSSTDYVKKFPKLVDLAIRRIVGTIEDWKISNVVPVSIDLTVELKIDPSLPANARNYRVEFGKPGFVTKLVMTGPALKK